jgi:hypothetical protein
MIYVLDANTFIQAKRRFYAFDICPGHWASLVWHQRQGNLCSIDRVADEIRRGGDELARWAVDSLGEDAFVSTNGAEVVSRYADLITWVQTQSQFLDYAKEQFAEVADGWLVAYAKSVNGFVVTLEEFDPLVKKRIPIPNICRAFDVGHVTPFEMLRRLNVQLSWQLE